MKRFGLGFLFLCSVSLFAASKDYNVSFRQIDAQKSQLTYMLSDFDIQTRMVNDRLFTEILFHSFNHTSQKGFAQLPVITKAVQLSPDKNIDLIIKNVEYEDYTLDDPLLPSPGVKYRTEKNSNDYIKFDRSSLTDNWYPPEIAAASSPYIVKDIRGTNVTLHPFRYNAAKKILRVYTRIVIEMDENNSTPVNPLISHGSPISDELRSVYQSAFMNFKSTNALSKYSQLTMQQLGDILVIATPRDETAIDSFINWKKEKGYHVYKEIVPAGTNVTDLIKQKYNENNKILYVQLIGDWQDIKGYADSSSGAPLDPKLGCVVGDDDYPDICIGRFPANSADDVTAQVSKIIQYEKSMTEQDTWLSTATGIASDEGSGDDFESDSEHQEVIWRDKLHQFTYENYNSIYDPSASKELVQQALKSGTGLINYTGHGDINGWYTSGFHADDIAGLENGHKLPFIVSVACDNGLFNGEKDCFAETWMKKANGGAVGMLAASVNLPWSSSMRGQDYFMDVLVGGYNYDEHENQYGINTSGQRTTLGSIIFNGFILMLSEMSGYTDIETVQSWNLFGDASMQIRTKAPQAMSLSNSTISVNEPFETEIYSDSAFAGALVTLSQNGRYYSGESDASGRVYIDHDLQAGKAKLVVTAFNMETIYRDIYVLDQTELPGYSMDNTMVECEQGIFFDNGGVNGAYSENENIIMTIYPQTAGTAIHAVFKTFDVDSTDKLYVFNGADVTAEEITGSPFYGSNIPPQISANNPDGALTFHFISDSSLNGEGWLAEISSGVVSAINTKPTAGLTELRLYSNYPNPFNPTTTIPFNLAKNAQVILEVFDMTGKRVSVLIDDAMTAGYHEVKFNAANLSSGIYVYRLQAGSFTRVKKMMILK